MRNTRIKTASVTGVSSVLAEVDENDYNMIGVIHQFLGALLTHSGYESRLSNDEVAALTLVFRRDGGVFLKIDSKVPLEDRKTSEQ